MKVSNRLSLRLAPRACSSAARPRLVHASAAQAAHVVPVLGTGPPPEPPAAAAAAAGVPNDRIERRRRQAELLRATTVVRNAQTGKSTTLGRRFWRDVGVHAVNGALEVHLDTRPLRHPQTKETIRLPTSKPNLATAVALEWDVLTSARQSTKQQLIPLTGLVCRALDIAQDDASGAGSIRKDLVTSVLRFLDTDSMLCWAPPAGPYDLRNDAGECLRDLQKRAAADVTSFLTTHVWAGARIEPVLDEHGIMPRRQPEGVCEIVQAWVHGLDAWEIAGLERAVLAGKSLVVAARLVAEWSEGAAGKRQVGAERYGIHEAARDVSLEVDWQAMQWGEVEDTHDVQKEDLRRQLGSTVLLVSGTGRTA